MLNDKSSRRFNIEPTNAYTELQQERNRNQELTLKNQELQMQLDQLKTLYYQQKQYYLCLQEQFDTLQETLVNTQNIVKQQSEQIAMSNNTHQSIIQQLEHQMEQQNEQLNRIPKQQDNKLQESLLKDLQGLEYLVGKLKKLIHNKLALDIVEQIQSNYDKLRTMNMMGKNESHIYMKLISALDKKLDDIINQDKENGRSGNVLQHSYTEQIKPMVFSSVRRV